MDAGSELPLVDGDDGQSAAGSLPFRRLDGGGGDGVGEVTLAFFSRRFGVLDVLESAGAADGSGVVSLGDSGELDLEVGFGRFSPPDFSPITDDDCEGATVGRRGLCGPRRLSNVSACL